MHAYFLSPKTSISASVLPSVQLFLLPLSRALFSNRRSRVMKRLPPNRNTARYPKIMEWSRTKPGASWDRYMLLLTIPFKFPHLKEVSHNTFSRLESNLPDNHTKYNASFEDSIGIVARPSDSVRYCWVDSQTYKISTCIFYAGPVRTEHH